MWWTLRQLKSKNPKTRRHAVEKIAEVKNEETFDLLVQSLKDEDAGVVAAAAKALSEVRDRRAVEPLLDALKPRVKKEKTREDEKAEDAIIRALREIPDPRAFPLLMAAFQAKDHGEVKYLIVEILGEIGDERCVERLFDFLQGTDDGFRGAAGGALARMGEKVVEPLTSILQDSKANYHAREETIRRLGQIRDKRAVEPLLRTLNDEDSYIRELAEKALKRFDQKTVKAVQDRLIEEKSASKGILSLMQCIRTDAVDKERLLSQAILELKETGEEGSKALAEITRDLVHSRSKEINWALQAARDVVIVPELSKAIRLAAAASTSRTGIAGRFDPETVGLGKVAWSDDTHARIKHLALQTLEAFGKKATPSSPADGESSSIDINSSWTKSIESGDTDALGRFLDKVIDVNASNERGNTALMTAAKRHDNDLLLNLLLRGADYNARNVEGRTALIEAAVNHNTDAVRILLECGALVNIKDEEGWTPLIWSYEDPDTLQVLIEAGADVNATNNLGRSALILAAREGHINILRALIDAGADVRAKDGDGNSALMWAGNGGHTNVVYALRNAGA